MKITNYLAIENSNVNLSSLLIIAGLILVFVLYTLLLLLQGAPDRSRPRLTRWKSFQVVFLKAFFPGILLGLLISIILDKFFMGLSFGLLVGTVNIFVFKQISKYSDKEPDSIQIHKRRKVLLTLALFSILLGFTVISIFFLHKLI